MSTYATSVPPIRRDSPRGLARPYGGGGLGGSVLALTLGLALAGCATRSPAPAEPGTGPAAQAQVPPTVAPSPSRNPLDVERRWLQQWFDGTPVVIAQPQREALAVDVPREFCFDTGRAEVKPALKAVLDKLAQSMRRVPSARLQVVAAPADASGDALLARQRAARVREHLRSRGVAEDRLGSVRVASTAAVQLRLQTPPPVAAGPEDALPAGE